MRQMIKAIHSNMEGENESRIQAQIMGYLQKLQNESQGNDREYSENYRSVTNLSKEEICFKMQNKFNNSIIIEEEALTHPNPSALSLKNGGVLSYDQEMAALSP